MGSTEKNPVEQDIIDRAATRYLIAANNGAEYGSEVIDKTGITRSHVSRLTKKFELYDIVKIKKVGRRKMMELTEKGKKIAENIEEIRDISSQLQPSWNAEKLPDETEGLYVCIECRRTYINKEACLEHSHEEFTIEREGLD